MSFEVDPVSGRLVFGDTDVWIWRYLRSRGGLIAAI